MPFLQCVNMIYIMKVSIIWMVCVGLLFKDLCVIKIVRSERNLLFLLFSCYLIKPYLFLVLTQNHSPGIFCIIFTQVCHCYPVWAVFEN